MNGGAADGEDKAVLNVEVCLRPESQADLGLVKAAALAFLTSLSSIRYTEAPLAPPSGQHPLLEAHVQSMHVVDLSERVPPGKLLLQWDVAWNVLVFQLDTEPPADDDEGEDNTPAYREWSLPAAEFHGSWETLYYETEIKQRLLRYATSALLFSESRVNPRLISWNRVVLLHGPPGTGKTSLCQALAQKLTIRLSDRYSQGGALIEVNAHSLFSKWFSESGKLVSRLFTKIREVVDESDTLVFVLIDEVESLTAARKAAVSGSEPADAIRAVNALLTRLDQLRASPNVMVLTTSNITEAIDLAFVDRADIKAYIGNPNLQARYEILRTCIAELQQAAIIMDAVPLALYGEACQLEEEQPGEVSAAAGAAEPESSSSSMDEEGETDQLLGKGGTGQLPSKYLSRCLLEVARAAEGFSGRTLRKLPFLAHAAQDFPAGRCSCLQYVNALLAAVQRERADRASLSDGT